VVDLLEQCIGQGLNNNQPAFIYLVKDKATSQETSNIF
jgi:hypothetical protein